MTLHAIENETTDENWNEGNEVLISESCHMYHLFKDGVILDIYFSETAGTVAPGFDFADFSFLKTIEKYT